MKFWKLMLIMALMAGLFAFAACDDDDDDDDTTPVVTIEDLLVGEWLMAGSNVPPAVAYWSIDTAVVVFEDDNTLTLDQHHTENGWLATLTGTWAVVESESGSIHSISLDYTSLVQGGIVEVVEGTPDIMKLEVVPTNSDIEIPSPENGFGEDGSNVQIYEKQ